MEFDEYSKQYQGKKQFHFILLNVYRLHLQAERMLKYTELRSILSLAYFFFFLRNGDGDSGQEIEEDAFKLDSIILHPC